MIVDATIGAMMSFFESAVQRKKLKPE